MRQGAQPAATTADRRSKFPHAFLQALCIISGSMPPARDATSFRAILGDKNFARLWYGQIISSLGDRFYQFALLYVILGIKQGMYVGKDSAQVTFLAMLPGFLLAPLYGHIIDRYSRRWVMFYADLAITHLRAAVMP